MAKTVSRRAGPSPFAAIASEPMNLVDVKVHAPTATILMDRSSVGNALDEQLIGDLGQALDDLHQEKRVRAVVLTGAGEDFCLGMDLLELHQHTELDELLAMPRWIEHWQRLADLVEKFLRFPKPVVAAVDGKAHGAGFSLALTADILVASQTASFSATAIQRGMVAGVLAPLLAFRTNASLASRMLLTGETLSSKQALRLGLVARRVASPQIWVAANEFATVCSAHAASPLAVTKRLLNETIGETLLTQLSVGAATAATACSTETAAEGLKAFAAKRPAVWPS
ncbi:MAG: enoyl-CoA hydratase/isomerase family protein [Planctomycetaceae bacterium]